MFYCWSQAVNSFSRAVHLNPEDTELREDDLDWAFTLLRKRERLDQERLKEKQTSAKTQTSGVKLTELKETVSEPLDELTDDSSGSDNVVEVYKNTGSNTETGTCDNDNVKKMHKLPYNYVQMRDFTS